MVARGIVVLSGASDSRRTMRRCFAVTSSRFRSLSRRAVSPLRSPSESRGT
jgi:hypothetical protein